MKAKYRILISAIDAFGHINCTLGFGELLAAAGHEVTFAHRRCHKKLSDARGFKFIPFDETLFADRPPNIFVEWVQKNLSKFRDDAMKRFCNWTDEDKVVFGTIVHDYELMDVAIRKILDENKDSFDLFLGDFVTRFPALYESPIPVILIYSMNPISLFTNAPPPFSGFPVGVDSKLASEFEAVYRDAMDMFINNLYSWWAKCNVPGLPIDGWLREDPKQLGFYHYPEKLDYNECGPIVNENWIRVDAAIRTPDDGDTFVLPDSLKGLPGKLIYFSLGSIGSADVHLMNRLVRILSKSPHRFIVSKGPRGDEVTLGANMWGEKYVNQIAILKEVDMVITHGGNNTFLETIYFGKPLIVIPFFFDQFDNAQRVVDCKIGRRLDTVNLEEKTLLDLIEDTLNDTEMTAKISSIAESMRCSTSRARAIGMIEKLIEDRKKDC